MSGQKTPQDQSSEEWLDDYNGKTPSVQPPELSSENCGEGVVDEHALIPEGKYCAEYITHELNPNFKGYGDKLVISFVINDGEYAGEIIRVFFNITITKSGFTSQGGSRWVKEMRGLFPERRRKDRLPPLLLKNKKVIVDVCTVTKGKGKRTLDKVEQYSKISELIKICE